MLTVKQANKENSVEELFCKRFKTLKCVPMSNDTTELLINLALSKNDISIPENKKPFLYKVIEKRISACFTFKITDIKLLLFLCDLTQTPGMAVMYLAYLQYWAKKHNTTNINLDLFCMQIFPSGFPLEEDLHILWDYCKVKSEGDSDNLLDYQNGYKTIQFN
jgi:hypothetical protein